MTPSCDEGPTPRHGRRSHRRADRAPPEVTTLYAVDPMERGRTLAAGRIAASATQVEFVGLDGQRIELDDGSVDAALSTWTLCTIPDAAAAICEVRRVLRPGGALHFAEHGAVPDEKIRSWQDRLSVRDVRPWAPPVVLGMIEVEDQPDARRL